VGRDGEQKTLPIRGHVVRRLEPNRLAPLWKNACSEQRSRAPRFESSLDRHWNRVDVLVASEVVQFGAVTSPSRLHATADGNLPPVARRREALHVHFVSSRLVGRVRNPAAVGRYLRLRLVKRRFGKGKRLPIAVKGEHPQIRGA